ncbi:hypothetical protein WJX79_005400 [Trebouxia sp. C0005]
MALSAGGAMIIFGLGLFMYAAWSALQYRDMLKLTQQEFASVPLLVKIEVLLAAVSCMWGSLQVSGEFKPVSSLKFQRGLDANTLRLDFMSLNHRGQILPLAAPPLK